MIVIVIVVVVERDNTVRHVDVSVRDAIRQVDVSVGNAVRQVDMSLTPLGILLYVGDTVGMLLSV